MSWRNRNGVAGHSTGTSQDRSRFFLPPSLQGGCVSLSRNCVLGFQPGEASPGIITGSWAVSNRLASGSLDTQLGVVSGHTRFPQHKRHLQWQPRLQRMLRGLMPLNAPSPDWDTSAHSSRIPTVPSFLRLGDGACMEWQPPRGQGVRTLWFNYL